MATIANLLLPQDEEKPVNNPPPVAQSSWVQDLISKRYAPETERIKRQPVGFQFKQNPFDPSSYYNQMQIAKNTSAAVTSRVNIEAQNKMQRDYEASQAALQGALNGIDPKFTGGNYDFSGKSRKYHLGHVSSNTAKWADFLGSRFGIQTIGGYREHGSVPGSDHPKGRAIDLMINNVKN